MKKNIVLLPGDGIGPEVVEQAVRVLEAAAASAGASLSFTERLLGGCSIDKFGTAMTDETLVDCQKADAVLLGAVGGPKWDDPQAKVRPEQGLLGLRKAGWFMPTCARSACTPTWFRLLHWSLNDWRAWTCWWCAN